MRLFFCRFGSAIVFLLLELAAQFDSYDIANNSFKFDHQAPDVDADGPLLVFAMQLLQRRFGYSARDAKSKSMLLRTGLAFDFKKDASRDYEFINAFLRPQEFDLGDHGPFDAPAGLRVYIKNLVCQKLSLGALRLTSHAHNEKTHVRADLKVSKVSISCRAAYTVKSLGLPIGWGNFKADSKSSSSIGAQLKFSTSEDEDFDRDPPRSVTSGNCKTHQTCSCKRLTEFHFDDVNFEGHGGTDGLGNTFFRSTVGSQLADAFQSKICEDNLPDLLHDMSHCMNSAASKPIHPEYSSFEEDNAAALALAHQHNTSVLNLEHDNVVYLLLRLADSMNLNQMLKDAILKNVDSSIPLAGEDVLQSVSLGYVTGTLILEDVVLHGVNSVRDVTLFETLSKHSATHSICIDEIKLQVTFVWNTTSPEGNQTFPVNVTFAVQGVKLLAQTMIAIDKQKWRSTTIGSFWETLQHSRPAACALKALLTAELTNLKILFDSMITSEVHSPRTDDGLPSGLEHVVGQALDLAIRLYGGFLEERVAPYVLQSLFRQKLNSFLKEFEHDPKNQICPPFNYEVAGGIKLANFSGKDFRDISEMLNSNFHPDSSAQRLVGQLVQSWGGRRDELVLTRGDTLDVSLSQTHRYPHFDFRFRVSNVKATNVDTVHDLLLLQPQGAYSLHNAAGFGLVKRTGRRPGIKGHVRLHLTFKELEPDPSLRVEFIKQVKGDAEVELRFHDLMAIMDIFALFNVNKLMNLTVSRINSLCFIGCFEDMAMKALSLVVDDLDLDIRCRKYEDSCSPEVLDVANRSHSRYIRDQATEQFNHYVHETLALFQTSIASKNLYKWAHRSHNQCWDSPDDPSLQFENPSQGFRESRLDRSMSYLIAGLSVPLLLLALGGFGFAYTWVQRPCKQAVDDKQSRSARNDQGCSDSTRRRRAMSLWRKSMQSRTQPFVAGVFLNAILFLVAHFHVGAEINIVMTVMGVEARYHSWAEFNVLQTVSQLLQNDSYLLAGLILVFSVIWPYVKLVSLLAMIFIPPDQLSYHRREKYLIMMDRLGKYSMLDVYFIILVFGFLQLSFGSPPNNLLLGSEFIKIKLEVMPCMGIVALILGVLLSICLNQIALSMHRKSIDRLQGRDPREKLGDEKEALCNHAWKVHLRSEFSQKMRRGGMILISLAMILSAALMLVGWFVYFCDTKIHGLAGLIKYMEKHSAQHELRSFFSMATDTLKQAQSQRLWSYCLGIFLVIACQVVFAGVLPVLQVACMLVLWLKPLTLKSQKRLTLFVEAASAVASIEVFLFAISVSNVEIEHLTVSFLSYAEDSDMMKLLQRFRDLGVIDKAHILSVDVAYHIGWVVLAWGATCYCMLSSLIIKWSMDAEHDRLAAFYHQQGWQLEPDERHGASAGTFSTWNEVRSKLQYFGAYVQMMEITDLDGKEASDEFWSQCHRGGMPSQQSESSGRPMSLVVPLLRTEMLKK